MAHTNILDPTQIVALRVDVQRIIDFDGEQAPYINANALFDMMRHGGYDTMTFTRTQGGGLTVQLGWPTDEDVHNAAGDYASSI